MNEILSLVYSFARAAWRRRWWAAAVALPVVLVGWIIVMAMPDRYEASARAFVDARTPLRPVLEGIAIEDNYESQVSLVREALLSRPQLEAVARSTQLDRKVDTPAEMEALINALKKQIVVTTASASGQQWQSSDMIYTINYQHTDRSTAVEVVRTLLDNFVQGTLSGNRSGANEVQGFLGEQIVELQENLGRAEEQLADFMKRNIGMIPGERGDYYSRLDQEMSGLQQAETALAVVLSQRAELERQLQNTQMYLPGASGAPGLGGTTPDITQRRMAEEQALEADLLRYTDRNPAVIARRESIAALRAREAEELADLQRGGAGTGAIRSLATNPVYQQVQTELNRVQVQIASHQGAAAQHRREIAALRGLVDQRPEIDQEYARLRLAVTTATERLQQILARSEQARITDAAAQAGIVRFEVIEPPRAGLEPVAPKRQILVLVCLFFAIAAGVGVSILPQIISPTVDDVASLKRRFDLPVLGAVSALRSDADMALAKQQVRKFVLVIASLFAAAAVLMVLGGAISRAIHGTVS